MSRQRTPRAGLPRRCLLAAALLSLATGTAVGAESDPLPVPRAGSRAEATRLYNEGVALLLARDFPAAQRKFEAALAAHEALPEAHNNLAYTLRMQGRQNFAASLTHYNRAIELKPDLAQAYMYRGVLFLQQGDAQRARQDLERLRKIDAKLAVELEQVVAGAAEGQGRGGVAPQYD